MPEWLQVVLAIFSTFAGIGLMVWFIAGLMEGAFWTPMLGDMGGSRKVRRRLRGLEKKYIRRKIQGYSTRDVERDIQSMKILYEEVLEVEKERADNADIIKEMRKMARE